MAGAPHLELAEMAEVGDSDAGEVRRLVGKRHRREPAVALGEHRPGVSLPLLHRRAGEQAKLAGGLRALDAEEVESADGHERSRSPSAS